MRQKVGTREKAPQAEVVREVAEDQENAVGLRPSSVKQGSPREVRIPASMGISQIPIFDRTLENLGVYFDAARANAVAVKRVGECVGVLFKHTRETPRAYENFGVLVGVDNPKAFGTERWPTKANQSLERWRDDLRLFAWEFVHEVDRNAVAVPLYPTPEAWRGRELEGVNVVTSAQIEEAYGELTPETRAKAARALESKTRDFQHWVSGESFAVAIFGPRDASGDRHFVFGVHSGILGMERAAVELDQGLEAGLMALQHGAATIDPEWVGRPKVAHSGATLDALKNGEAACFLTDWSGEDEGALSGRNLREMGHAVGEDWTTGEKRDFPLTEKECRVAVQREFGDLAEIAGVKIATGRAELAVGATALWQNRKWLVAQVDIHPDDAFAGEGGHLRVSDKVGKALAKRAALIGGVVCQDEDELDHANSGPGSAWVLIPMRWAMDRPDRDTLVADLKEVLGWRQAGEPEAETREIKGWQRPEGWPTPTLEQQERVNRWLTVPPQGLPIGSVVVLKAGEALGVGGGLIGQERVDALRALKHGEKAVTCSYSYWACPPLVGASPLLGPDEVNWATSGIE